MKYLVIALKGILLGIASVAIPGLSASTVAIMVGTYAIMIESISGIVKDFKKYFPFLGSLVLGFFIGAILGSISVNIIYVLFPLPILLLIIGCIVGSIPSNLAALLPKAKKPSNWITFVLVITLIIVYSFCIREGSSIEVSNLSVGDYIHWFIIGIITSTTLVIPGVDFAVVFLALGYYYAFTNMIYELATFNNVLVNLSILGTYLVGYGIGSFLLSKIIRYLMNRFNDQFQFASFAFVIAAPIIIVKTCIMDNPDFRYSTTELIVGVILGLVSFIIIYLLSRYFQKKKRDNVEIEDDKLES